MFAPNESRPLARTKVVVATSVIAQFISFWGRARSSS